MFIYSVLSVCLCSYSCVLLNISHWKWRVLIGLMACAQRPETHLCTETKESSTLRSMCEHFQKCILICLCCIKYEINRSHSGVQRYIWWYKKMVLIVLFFVFRVAQKFMHKLCAMSRNIWNSMFSFVMLFFPPLLYYILVLVVIRLQFIDSI